jgi:ABC-2 type transport system ATP-binding protein
VISVSNLTKRYGPRVAVNNVSFEIARGEVVGFLGPNGAGKTTTLRILAGVLDKTQGVVRIAGHDISTHGLDARSAVGYMPEAVPLYPEMRVGEYLTFRAELKGVTRHARKNAVHAAMERAKVTDYSATLIGKLSKGYRQRVGLADALVASPPILILDEPTAGLDPNQIRDVRALVRSLGKDHTVLLSTHILPEVEASCDRVLLLAHGTLVAQGPTEQLRALQKPTGLDLVLRGDEAIARTVLEAHPAVDALVFSSAASTFAVHCTWKASQDSAALAAEGTIDALVRAGIAVREARAVGGSLEDVFAALTREETP